MNERPNGQASTEVVNHGRGPLISLRGEPVPLLSDKEKHDIREQFAKTPELIGRVLELLPDSIQTVGDESGEVVVDFCSWTDPEDSVVYPVPVIWIRGQVIDSAGNLGTPEGFDPAMSREKIREHGWHPNLMYFPRAYCFHPDAVAEEVKRQALPVGGKPDRVFTRVKAIPAGLLNAMPVGLLNAIPDGLAKAMPKRLVAEIKKAKSPEVAQANGSRIPVPAVLGESLSLKNGKLVRDKVMTVDTGQYLGTYQGGRPDIGGNEGAPDSWAVDAVTGHGPAIADLIGARMGDPQCSFLTSMDYAAGKGTGYLATINGKKIRGFSTDSLLTTLKSLNATQHPFQVLNLSLGTTECPNAMVGDPVCDEIIKWLDDDGGRSVVVAAGNHGTPVPSWPAALPKYPNACTDAPKLTRVRDRIYSVGSGVNASRRFDTFSGHGPWVSCLRPGKRVEVAYPNYDETVWTGTSFAAPQVAAELAMGYTRTQILTRP